jgi:hypothetical protein
VETRDDCFFEGAWDGPLEAYRFDQAIALFGSGGRLADDAILFASPSHLYERLHSIRVGEELYISNSLAFLLAQAEKELDINYPHYFFDFLEYYRNGIRITKKRIRIQDQRYVELHDCGNFMVKPDLTITRFEKNVDAPPSDFNDYVAFMERTVKSISTNAVHPARKPAYRPVTMISQGYDSTAASVFASRAGCREAVTFRKSHGKDDDAYVDDSGTAIAAYLGLQTTEYERHDFRKLSGLPTAEFYLNPFDMHESLAVMEDQLVGALLMTGNSGDYVWDKTKESGLPLLQRPVAQILTTGNTMTEFRLRVGFIHLPVPSCGVLNTPFIHRITLSPEMTPWTLGGEYDRPIARRIAEEAGIPRELFGQRKIGGPWLPPEFKLAPADERDFLKFYQANVNKHASSGQQAMGRRDKKKRGSLHRLRSLKRFLLPSARRLIRSFVGYRLEPRWRSKNLYKFHWGFERTKERYQSALNQHR